MYYEVWVASQSYHKPTPLTYSYEAELASGTVVLVPLQNRQVLGIVVKKVKKPAFRTKSIKRVIARSVITQQSLELMAWLKAYYPAPSGLIHGLFAPAYLNGLTDQEGGDEAHPSTQSLDPPLTAEQQQAIVTITSSHERSILLQGETGSGKTRVYIELAKLTVAHGKSAVILTPEIGLTPQLYEAFRKVFGNQAVLLHSDLTPKERRQAWLKLARQPGCVVIGPRSVLFAPVQTIGLIVIDEAHDYAYKQEQAPYYVTSRVAGQLAKIHQARLVLGTATPPVSDYFVFERHKLPIVRMERPATGQETALDISLVDLRDRSQFSTSQWLSNSLLGQLEKAMARREQALLFLNRRGTARVIMCQICGWRATCPRCDLPLTYHGDQHQAVCHTCGHTEPTASACPSCGATEIIFKSAGTKTIVTELERLFPKARLQRFDSDLKKSERLPAHYSAIKKGAVDILVGTQMLGKGLDLPYLSVVGVILADTALNFPDYTAEERTYQMLNQVIGRVGRGHRAAQVIVQTYNPGSPIIKQALTKNYADFYTNQLTERRQFHFPPYCHLLKLSVARLSQATAQQAATTLATSLKQRALPVEVVGPSPAFVAKAGGLYHWQLVIKAPGRSSLLSIIASLPANWSYDIDPLHLL